MIHLVNPSVTLNARKTWRSAGKKCCLILCVTIVFFVRQGICDSEDEPSSQADRADSKEQTIITSNRLDYDAQQQLALFEGNVVVNDPEMHIETDLLSVLFDEDNAIVSIKAEGNVVIKQDDITGTGGKALYHVAEGTIVLTENPRVQRGADELKGDTITFYRGTGRMLCEPNAVLKMHAVPQLKGENIMME